MFPRKHAGDLLVRDEPYLIDETTAVVRFIIPCKATRVSHGDRFDASKEAPATAEELAEEVQQIRGLFVEVFVEAIVPSIRGEALIWMLETSPTGLRLYELERDESKRRRRGGSPAAVPMPSAADAHDPPMADAPLLDGAVPAAANPGAGTAAAPRGASQRRRDAAAGDKVTRAGRETAQDEANANGRSDARPWLRHNGYGYVADLIDGVIAGWSAAGKGNRKNWWDVLAGGAGGRACTVAGRAFPVLAIAQQRKGLSVTANAIPALAGQVPPPLRSGRGKGKDGDS